MKKAPKFKLVFKSNLHGAAFSETNPDDTYDGTFTRVIVVENLKMAKKVAKAMIGEEVGLMENLVNIVSVESTNDQPGIYVYCGGKSTWDRVLAKLKINEQDVEWVQSIVNGENEYVGFVPK